jgi:hypothetical protein
MGHSEIHTLKPGTLKYEFQNVPLWISECLSFWVKHYGNPNLHMQLDLSEKGYGIVKMCIKMQHTMDTQLYKTEVIMYIAKSSFIHPSIYLFIP